MKIADTKKYVNNAANKVREAFFLFGKKKKEKKSVARAKKAGKLVVSFLFFFFYLARTSAPILRTDDDIPYVYLFIQNVI